MIKGGEILNFSGNEYFYEKCLIGKLVLLCSLLFSNRAFRGLGWVIQTKFRCITSVVDLGFHVILFDRHVVMWGSHLHAVNIIG